MLENIFRGRTADPAVQLKNRFYTTIPVIKQDIKAALKNKGMYLLDPDSANGYSVGAALVIVAPFLIAQFSGYKQIFNSVILLIVCGIVSAIIWWLFAREMSAKTVQGRTHPHRGAGIPGVHESRGRRPSETHASGYIRKIPALCHGARSGASLGAGFAGIIQNPPKWYVSPNGMTGFNPIFFSSSMHSMASDMNQVFVSAPRSSSSGSGFGGGGGGGFSGGGFGGGGGSGF
jgi:uncharacterized membrane protein YgcG